MKKLIASSIAAISMFASSAHAINGDDVEFFGDDNRSLATMMLVQGAMNNPQLSRLDSDEGPQVVFCILNNIKQMDLPMDPSMDWVVATTEMLAGQSYQYPHHAIGTVNNSVLKGCTTYRIK